MYCIEIIFEDIKKAAIWVFFHTSGGRTGRGCGTPSMTSQSKYLQISYELGRNLRD